MKRVSAGLGLALMTSAMVTLSGCASNDNQPSGKQTQVSAPQMQQYRNTLVGYTLTYPDQWGTDVIEQDSANWMGRQLTADNVAMFYYKDFETDSEPQPLVALAVYSQQQWDQLKNRSRPLPPVVAHQGDQVLTAYIAPQNPYSPDSRQGQEFARRVPSPNQLSDAISW